jgi:hypothetical protein
MPSCTLSMMGSGSARNTRNVRGANIVVVGRCRRRHDNFCRSMRHDDLHVVGCSDNRVSRSVNSAKLCPDGCRWNRHSRLDRVDARCRKSCSVNESSKFGCRGKWESVPGVGSPRKEVDDRDAMLSVSLKRTRIQTQIPKHLKRIHSYPKKRFRLRNISL